MIIKIRRAIFWIGTVATLSFSTCATSEPANQSYELGLEATADYRYSEALKYFRAAAAEGDRQAQRTLGLMLLYGGGLYGGDVHGEPEQAKRWLQAASAHGDDISSFALKVLATHRQ